MTENETAIMILERELHQIEQKMSAYRQAIKVLRENSLTPAQQEMQKGIARIEAGDCEEVDPRKSDTDIEYNALGEPILPIFLDSLTEVRVALSADPKQFLEAFEHVAPREQVILRALHAYLKALKPDQIESLIPVLRAMGRRRAERVVNT